MNYINRYNDIQGRRKQTLSERERRYWIGEGGSDCLNMEFSNTAMVCLNAGVQMSAGV